MRAARQIVWSGLAFVALLGLSVVPAQGQGKSKAKHYAVSGNKALSVSRSVLIERGFHVVRVERVGPTQVIRSEEHTSELQSQSNLVCRLLLEKKNKHLNVSFILHSADTYLLPYIFP